MSKIPYLIPLISVLFVSCTLTPTNTPPSQSGIAPRPATQDLENPSLITSGSISIEMDQDRGATNLPTIPPLHNDSSTAETINHISTLDELKSVNPNVGEISGNNHPKFVELQKKQITLGLLVSNLSDPELTSLRKKQNDIFQGVAVWTPQIKKIDKEITDAIASMNSTGGITQEQLRILTENRNQLMRDFQMTQVFKDYLAAQQTMIIELSKAMDTYNTPEIVTLQKEIQELNNQIYSVK